MAHGIAYLAKAHEPRISSPSAATIAAKGYIRYQAQNTHRPMHLGHDNMPQPLALPGSPMTNDNSLSLPELNERIAMRATTSM